MGDLRDHWETVHAAKAETDVSWYQPHAACSLALISTAADKAAPIIDIGAGASTLVDDLLSRGHSDLAVLDMAECALARSKARLGAKASRVAWIVADVTQWQPPRRYQVWHDRAVFHFLTSPKQQAAYIAALNSGTLPGATVVMATFALDGPEQCSGLPVQRYSPQTLEARIGSPFVLVQEAQETHRTPTGTEQRFSYALFHRKS